MHAAAPDRFTATITALFVIQFLSWSAMFCLRIGAVPLIAMGRLGGGAGAIAVVGACFAFYALLGAALAFAQPMLRARFGVRWVYGGSLLIGAGGIEALAAVANPIALLPAFAAIGIAWSVMATLPYAILAAAAPRGRGAHWLRIFGFSTVMPQIVITALLALLAQHLPVERMMALGGALMASGGVIALAGGGRFVVAAEDW